MTSIRLPLRNDEISVVEFYPEMDVSAAAAPPTRSDPSLSN